MKDHHCHRCGRTTTWGLCWRCERALQSADNFIAAVDKFLGKESAG